MSGSKEGRRKYTEHGQRGSKVYNSWDNMIKRCYRKCRDSKRYRGRGITVCEEWKNSAKSFIDWAMDNGWREGLHLDRIDNDGNYEPENCRFVEPRENSLNTGLLRTTNKSGYRGVSYDKERDKYVAQITVKLKAISLGRFETALEAAIVRDRYVVKNNLNYPLNFPEIANE